MIAIFEIVLPLALKIIGAILDKHKQSNEAKTAFYKFLEALEKLPERSVAAKKSIQDQKNRLSSL